MKKCISALICIVLVCSMLLTLTGCSSGGEKEKFLGTWQCELDMTDEINAEFAADESVAEYLSVDEFKLTVRMEFKEDDTYALRVDEAALDAAIDNLLESITDGLSRYMEALMLEQTGIEMSIDDILAAAGITMDDMVAQMFPEEFVAELKTEVVSGLTKEGMFKAEEGKLFTSDGMEHAVDPAVYETYTLEETTLTLLEYVGPEREASVDVYPMVFNKVS